MTNLYFGTSADRPSGDLGTTLGPKDPSQDLQEIFLETDTGVLYARHHDGAGNYDPWMPLFTLPAARVTHSADQTIATASLTTLAFNTEDYDTATLHDTATNNSRLTAPVAGIYAIGASVEWNANATGNREIQLLKNGTTASAVDRRSPVTEAGIRTQQSVYGQLALAAGDYIEVRVRQTSGGDLIARTATAVPIFFMHLLGAAP